MTNFTSYTGHQILAFTVRAMGSCPIKWFVSMVNINEHNQHPDGFGLQELEAITIDSVDGVLICTDNKKLKL